jgi:sulfite exporter TauE/SafE
MFIPAFIIGALGSFHCIGMCGPIAMAVPLGRNGGVQGLSRGLIYNLGRIFTYSVLGLIVGLLGQRLALGGYQQALSITIGILILLGVILPRQLTKHVDPTSTMATVLMKARSTFGAAMRSQSLLGPLTLGLMNGLLPCGMVYVGLAGALAVGDAMDSAMFMAAFGMGTLPMMIAVHLAGDLISVNLRSRIRGMLPYAMAVMGILFVLRGMGLGVPYISPSFNTTTGGVEQCHAQQ